MLYLEARVGGRTLRWPVPARSFVVGRQTGCEIVLPERSVSRRHLRVEVVGDRLRLEDLESRHGLWVQGTRQGATEVGIGDWFHCGVVPMVFREGITLAPDEPPPRAKQEITLPHDPPTPVSEETDAPERVVPGCEDGVLRRVAAALRGEGELETTFNDLLGALAGAGGIRSAVLLVEGAGECTVLAETGPPLPPEVEARIERVRRVPGCHATSSGSALVVGIDAPHGARGALVLYPWAHGGEPDALVDLVASLTERELSRLARGEQSDEAEGRTLRASRPALGEFVAVSPLMRELLAEIDRLAPSGLPLMLSGESGTGKELLARRIHERSPRSTGPFVAINCAALPSELLEAELFGIEQGVATGVGARAGWFVRASGGTMLLDEIGDLPSTLQPKLLRALESGAVVPVGAAAPVPVDVRVIAATHRDLRAEVSRGVFRADLVYRLSGATIRVPPLRARPEDILPLARRFAWQAANDQGARFEGIDLAAARLLIGYSWPGNVRELRHAIARAVALADGPILHEDLLPPEVRRQSDVGHADVVLGLHDDFRSARERFDRLYFEQLLERCDGNLTEVSRIAGLARSNLYKRLRGLGLR
jgi:DNA-binding NtrC family response regulator